MHSYFKKEVIIGFSVIFGSVVVFGVVIFFLSNDVASQTEKAVAARVLISERAAILGALSGLKSDSSEAARYRIAINAILVTQDQLLDFPRWLDGLARGRGLSLSFSFQGSPIAPSESDPGQVSFSVRASGGFANILGFLQDIEFRSPRFLLVLDSFSLRRSGDSYDFSTNGKVFFR